MANVTVNGTNYTGVNEVRLPITNGGGSEQSFVLPPSGSKSITANGSNIDVASYATVNVAVPTGITPTGTKNITANGTYDVTNFASANVNVSGGTTTLQQKSVTAPATGTTAVTPDSGYDGLSRVTVSPTPTETKSITANGTYTPTSGKYFSSVSVNVSGGGGGVNVATVEKTLTAAASSIQFTGLLGDPTSFAVVSESNLTTGASPYKTADVVFDGTNIFGQYITNTNNAQMTYSASAFTKSYSGGTLTITGSGTNFQSNAYKLVYTYGGSASDILTKTATVGSGATSISFTGLDAEPVAFSCILKGGNIGTASGYSRAQIVVGDANGVFGLHMGSSSQASTSSWNTSYNNGTFTITSVSSSNGGYFHQGTGFSYQLTYIANSTPTGITTEPLNVTSNGIYTAPSGKAYTPVTVSVSGSGSRMQSKTVTPGASQQTVRPDSGYDGLSQVTVNAIPYTETGNSSGGYTLTIGG